MNDGPIRARFLTSARGADLRLAIELIGWITDRLLWSVADRYVQGERTHFGCDHRGSGRGLSVQR